MDGARRIRVRDVSRCVAEHFSIHKDALMARSHAVRVVRPRFIAMMLCRELTGASLDAIGEYFGQRDHSTVLNAVRRARALAETNAEFAGHLAAVKEKLSLSA